MLAPFANQYYMTEMAEVCQNRIINWFMLSPELP